MGGAHEWIARLQETYVVNATSSWLVSLERSLAQMKEYQVFRVVLQAGVVYANTHPGRT